MIHYKVLIQIKHLKRDLVLPPNTQNILREGSVCGEGGGGSWRVPLKQGATGLYAYLTMP